VLRVDVELSSRFLSYVTGD